MTEMQQPGSSSNGKIVAMTVVLFVVIVAAIGLAILFLKGSGDDYAQNAPAVRSTPVDAGPATAPSGPAPTMNANARLGIPLPDVKFEKNAQFQLAGVTFLIIHYGNGWSSMDQHFNLVVDPAASKIEDDLWDIHAKWGVSGGRFDCRQTLKRIDDEHFTYDATFTSPTDVQTMGLMMELHLPAVSYSGYQLVADGEAVPLPAAPPAKGKETLVEAHTVKSLEIATPDGKLVVEGPLEVAVQDNRNFGQPTFTARLMFTPSKGPIKETSLKFKMRHVIEVK